VLSAFGGLVMVHRRLCTRCVVLAVIFRVRLAAAQMATRKGSGRVNNVVEVEVAQITIDF
jgi:hypothetical protein